MAKFNKSSDNIVVWNMKERNTHSLLMGLQSDGTALKIGMESSQAAELDVPYNLRICLRGLDVYFIDNCAAIFFAIQFTIVETTLIAFSK